MNQPADIQIADIIAQRFRKKISVKGRRRRYRQLVILGNLFADCRYCAQNQSQHQHPCDYLSHLVHPPCGQGYTFFFIISTSDALFPAIEMRIRLSPDPLGTLK